MSCVAVGALEQWSDAADGVWNNGLCALVGVGDAVRDNQVTDTTGEFSLFHQTLNFFLIEKL